MTPTLSRATLNRLPAGVDAPPLPPAAPGVVHLGLGAFHRAHQALVFDRLLREGDARWGVLGVAMRNPALIEALAPQDHLYTVRVADAQGVRWQVPGALCATALATRDRAQVIAAIAAPSTRWITLTVTEKGYGPELAALLVDGLAMRHSAGLGGLTVASCDNLADNGRKLLALCEAQGRTQGLSDAFITWLHEACAFPNSMVDRIVPAGTEAHRQAAREALDVDDAAALGTEGFWEWVIERRFADPSDADLLSRCGVQVVDAVRPFEEAKLRMLNGSHSAMACMGAVLGLPVIADCVGDAQVRAFIHGFMTDEIGPLVSRPNWPAYRDALLQRFANPSLRHSVHQIATDSSLKIPQRWVPCAELRLAQGLPVTRLAFCAAAWMRYARGVDEAGHAYTLSDPMAPTVQPLAQQHAGDAAATVAALGGLEAIWGSVLSRHAGWQATVTQALQSIEQHGLRGALARL